MAKKIFTSPKGTAVYPRLTTPDTKFNPGGVYSVKLNVEAVEAKPLAAQIAAAMKVSAEEAKKTAKKAIKVADLPYTIEENGTYTFNFKLNATGKKKTGEVYNQKPALFDAELKPITGAPRIGGGSTIRVGFEIAPFYVPAVGAGVSLRLRAVQIIKLVEWGGDGSYFGFEAEEGDEAPVVGFDEAKDESTAGAPAGGESDDF